MANSTTATLLRYSLWANDRLLRYLATLPVQTLTQTRSEGAGSILKVLNHSRVVDRIWQAHLLGIEHGFKTRNTDPLPAFDELAQDQMMLDHWYLDYAIQLDTALHDDPVHFQFVDGSSGTLTRAAMLLHVVNHKTYHRGYVAQMLYQARLKPPTLDLPVFFRDA